MYACSGCGRAIEGKAIEVKTACRLKACDHTDSEKCVTTKIYAHESCLDAVVVIAAGKEKRQ